MDTKIVSNRIVDIRIGVDTAVANVEAPTIAEINGLIQANEAIRWDQLDLNVQESTMGEDPTLVDAAGSQVRETIQFGGTISFLQPQVTDTTSVLRQISNLVVGKHAKLVVAIRVGLPVGTSGAAGQVWNVYRVTADAQSRARNDSGYSYSANFRPRGEAGINVILPSVSAKAVAITVPSTATVGTPIQMVAMYEGVEVTVGAKWVSTDPTKLLPLANGWAIPLAIGSASISATYPGSAAGTASAVTIS